MIVYYTLYDINFCEALAVLCQPVYKENIIKGAYLVQARARRGHNVRREND